MKATARIIEWIPVSEGLAFNQKVCAIKITEYQSTSVIISSSLRWAGWEGLPYSVEMEIGKGCRFLYVSTSERPGDSLTISMPLEAYFDLDLTTEQTMQESKPSRWTVLALWFLCIPATVYAIGRMLWCVVRHPSKGMDIAIAVDRVANAALDGDPQETISSRAHRAMVGGQKWGCVLCKLLDVFQKGHCEKSAGK